MRVGIDIGGTFTDLVAATEDGIVVHKVSSTPSDPSVAFAAALARVEGDVDEVRHGTTVATNAVITRSGADIALITTKGFRHVLHLARQDRPSLYDLRAQRADPVVSVERCIGASERVGPSGEEIEPLDEDELRASLASVRGVDGVAVVLLHAYADPSHEERVAEIVREELGEHVGISLSSRVLAEFREYERASTTALNAYVQPAMVSYLDRIERSAGGRVGVMWSGGGVRSIARTIEEPVHTMLSGPAAGVLGATWACTACGFRDLVTIDMGGTSADVALVDAGEPAVAESSSVEGLVFRTPSIDVISVGAGGGSIAWVDEGGALRVGPASAGADPGPASYGRGGTEATVTDAQVVLGYLGDADLAGGELRLDRAAAELAIDALAEKVGTSRVEAAEGVLRVVRATMARAIRSVSVERGKDVRRYALVAFGGAGPLHATALARELAMTTVIVPPAPGALAALGLLVAARRADVSVSRPMAAESANDASMRSLLDGLAADARRQMSDEGVDTPRIEHHVDCRYVGQSHELRIAVEGEPSFGRITDAFHEAHRRRYGFERRGVGVECVTLRATATGPRADVATRAPVDGEVAPSGRRRVGDDDVPVFERVTLPANAKLEGPAIIAELDSTTWLATGDVATVAANGALVIEVG